MKVPIVACESICFLWLLFAGETRSAKLDALIGYLHRCKSPIILSWQLVHFHHPCASCCFTPYSFLVLIINISFVIPQNYSGREDLAPSRRPPAYPSQHTSHFSIGILPGHQLNTHSRRTYVKHHTRPVRQLWGGVRGECKLDRLTPPPRT